jgi:hypothetical protein
MTVSPSPAAAAQGGAVQVLDGRGILDDSEYTLAGEE